MGSRKAVIITGSATGVGATVLWLLEGARTVTGELLLLDSGTHLGTFGRAVVPAKG